MTYESDPPAMLNLFGAGRFARDAAQALRRHGIRVGAFLTSGEPAEASLDGVPWRRLVPADLAAPLWVAVFNHQAASDYGRLHTWLSSLGSTKNVHWPQHWYPELAEAMGWRFWLTDHDAYLSTFSEIAALREALDDDASRSALHAILVFRQNRPTSPPVPVAEPQYAPRWFRERLSERAAGRGLALVDGGAYQGETLRELATLLPIERAWAFEPDAANFAALAEAAATLPIAAVQPVATGLSDRRATLAFAAGDGAASHIAEPAATTSATTSTTTSASSAGTPAGTTHIDVTSLDEHLAGTPVDLIKLDVEGHELQALAGARATLHAHRPLLAIAAYHRWDDLWRIAAFLQEQQLGYRLRIAVHTHNSFDTVLYAFH